MLLEGRLARGGRVHPGWLTIEGERLAEAGTGAPPRTPDARHDGIISAGLVDLQVNGAAGREVTGGPRDLDAIDAVQLAHGVTSYLPTIPTTDPELASQAARDLEERVPDPRSPVEGIHLEGPFLSPEHAGMHPVGLLRAPAQGIPPAYSSPAVRLVTLAPELPGALELIADLRRRGIAVGLGHSGADAQTVAAAIARGASLVTHVFNAMAPLHHRRPGLLGTALGDERLGVTVIADGIHLHPLVLTMIRRAAAGRTILVSDAAPAAAAPEGHYRMAGVEIERRAGGEVVTASGTLAGSSLTLDVAVRRWAALTGATLSESLHAASERPRAALALDPGLREGAWADLALLDDIGNVVRVMRRGRWIDAN
jgi:N-acetylglucosamine-6-phosphate deacetylase